MAAAQGRALLAAVPVTLALVWSFFMSMFYTFPPKDMLSDIVTDDNLPLMEAPEHCLGRPGLGSCTLACL